MKKDTSKTEWNEERHHGLGGQQQNEMKKDSTWTDWNEERYHGPLAKDRTE